jgi:hypothetical protein
LNGSKLRLDLPAVEVRAVVCESQLEVPHSIGYSIAKRMSGCECKRDSAQPSRYAEVRCVKSRH